MPRPKEGFKQFTTHLSEALYERLAALCEETGRSIALEVEHAIERHLDNPPRLETPPLADAAPREARRPGRKQTPASKPQARPKEPPPVQNTAPARPAAAPTPAPDPPRRSIFGDALPTRKAQG